VTHGHRCMHTCHGSFCCCKLHISISQQRTEFVAMLRLTLPSAPESEGHRHQCNSCGQQGQSNGRRAGCANYARFWLDSNVRPEGDICHSSSGLHGGRAQVVSSARNCALHAGERLGVDSCQTAKPVWEVDTEVLTTKSDGTQLLTVTDCAHHQVAVETFQR